MNKAKIKHLRALIKRMKLVKYSEGICIALGDIAYEKRGGYMNCPWTGWNGLLRYYPIFKKYKAPKHTTFSQSTRKKVIESLVAKLNKKKDPHINSHIFNDL